MIAEEPELTNDKSSTRWWKQLRSILRSNTNWGVYRLGLPGRLGSSIIDGIPVRLRMTPCANI